MFALLLPILFSVAAPRPDVPAPPQRMLWLRTNAYHSDTPGGPSSGGAKALELGKPLVFFSYNTPNMCGFAAGPGFTEMAPEALLGWKVTVIPKRLGEDDVTLSVSWVRERSHKVEAQGSTEVLLRPGDSAPLDVAATPESTRVRGCHMTSAEALLALDPVEPNKAGGRSGIVSTDLWLVRRLADGKEETQQLNVRGAVNEEVSFYFDDVRSGELLMSVLGRIRPRARENGAIVLEFGVERQFRSGETNLGRGFSTAFPNDRPILFESPDNVISIEFPLSNEPKWKELGGQRLSIRIRTRRIR